MLYYTATVVSPGITVGPVKVLRRENNTLRRVLETPAVEQRLFEAACILAQGELEALIQQCTDKDQQDILTFQHAILDDATFLDFVADAIQGQQGALGAVQQALVHFSGVMRQIDDSYFAARAADIEDVGHRLCSLLAGEQHDGPVLEQPTILVGDDLYPSDLVQVDRHNLLGIVLAAGSAQSHAAIIARTLGIPAVILAGNEFLQLADGAEMALDANHGEFYLWPDDAVRARFSHQMQQARRRANQLAMHKGKPCVTRDGVRVKLLANCSNPEDVSAARMAGAEGVGLLRSEFLFITDHLPDEEEQLQFYTSCLEAAQGLPVTIRTIDAGADKRVAGVSAENEENPALGLRGIRLALAYENLLSAQLRALIRASAAVPGTPLRILLPMITFPEDMDRVKAILRNIQAELKAQKIPYAKDIPLGAMIETPAAAVMSDVLAQKSDFFSIGTNDLTQYILAADRTNMAVASYYRPEHHAVQRLIEYTVRNAKKAKISCCVCGESAADPALACRYAAMGIESLSMAAASLGEIKEVLCNTDVSVSS